MNLEFINPKFPRLWHGGDYNPEQWPREIWDRDVSLMQEARFTVATIGIFSWAKLEPDEGQFDFEWLDDIIDRLSKGDRWFILATPSAAPPAWLSRKYPETLRTGPDRVRKLHGNRVNFNLGSPIYREKTKDMARRLAERYGAHPRLLAWHMSNEYNGADYGAESIEQFRVWLAKKFGNDLDALNHAYWADFWSHTFSDWAELDAPGAPLGETAMQGLTVDWQRFVTDQTIEFMLNEAAPLREISPNVPITTNLMGTYPGLDYRKVAKHLDFSSWDSYPGFEHKLTDPLTWITAAFKHDLMRCVKPERPWLLMESTPSSSNWYSQMSLKRPGMHRFEGWQAVAHGSDGVQYFQWRQTRGSQEQLHGAVVGHAGDRDTRVFNEVREIGIELEAHPEIAGSLVAAEAALVYDWEVRWALEAACGPTQNDKRYEQTCIEHYKSLWELGIPTDIVGLDDPLDKYKLVIAPMAYSLRPGFAEKLTRFVEGGGAFLTTYLTGWVDENSLVFEGGFLSPLRQLLGLWSEEIDVLHSDEENHVEMLDRSPLGLSGSFKAKDFCELVHCESAEVLAVFGEEFYAGRPAFTSNSVGKGRAYYVASRNEQSFTDAVIKRLAENAGVKQIVESELPSGVTAQRRINRDKEFVFLMNANSHAVSISTQRWGEVRLEPRDVTIFVEQRVAAVPTP